jgi:hypothetical protein
LPPCRLNICLANEITVHDHVACCCCLLHFQQAGS